MAARKVRTCTDDNGRRRILRCADDPKRVQLCDPVCDWLPFSSFTIPAHEQCGGTGGIEIEYPGVRFVDPWRMVYAEVNGSLGGSITIAARTIGGNLINGFGANFNRSQLRLVQGCATYGCAGEGRVATVNAPRSKPNDGIVVRAYPGEGFIDTDMWSYGAESIARFAECVQLGSIEGIYQKAIGRVFSIVGSGECSSSIESQAYIEYPIYRGPKKSLTVSVAGSSGCRVSLREYSWFVSGQRWSTTGKSTTIYNPSHVDCPQSDISGSYTFATTVSEALVVLNVNRVTDTGIDDHLNHGGCDFYIEDIA